MASPIELRRIVAECRIFLESRLRKTLDEDPDFWGPWTTKPPADIIDLHLTPEHNLREVDREEIMSRLLMSAQNRQSASRVIGGSVEGGWDALSKMLLGFNPEAILARWDSPEELMEYFLALKAKGCIRGAVKSGTRSLWPQFCRTILSAARFMARHPTADSFRGWVDNFRRTPDTAAALPLILSQEIDGFGLALAADFLKELGCSEFPKPDVHIKALAFGLGISDAISDYRMMLDIMQAADAIGMTAYQFDKILWLIGSGRFYRVVVEGYELDIKRQSEAFLAHMSGVS